MGTNDHVEDVAARIKQLREDRNLTQAELGKHAGVSKQAVSSWERGVSEPERDALVALERNLRVNHHWITTGAGTMLLSDLDHALAFDAIASGDALPLTKEEQNIVRMWRLVPLDVRPGLLSVLKQVTKPFDPGYRGWEEEREAENRRRNASIDKVD